MTGVHGDSEAPGTLAALRRAQSLAILGLSTLVTACAGGLHSDAPATQVYVLRAAVHPQAEMTRPTASLHLGRPMAGRYVLVLNPHTLFFEVHPEVT